MRILMYGLEIGASLASVPFGPLIGLAIAAVLFVIPLLIAVLVVVYAPIIPILIHQYRAYSHENHQSRPYGRLPCVKQGRCNPADKQLKNTPT